LPLGALPVEALLLDGRQEARRRVDALLRENVAPALARPTFFAVGGGWRCFAKVQMLAAEAPVGVVHGYRLAAGEARSFAKFLLRLPPAKLAQLPGVPSRRARTLPAAALVLDRVLKHLGPKQVVFSALGLREGWLYSQLAPEERYLDPLVEGAQLVGLPFSRVPGFAAALVPWTASLFPGETPAEKRLRVAVCALSDLAWHDHVDLRAEESFRRLLQFPFIGIDHAERVFVAVAVHARYAGRPDAPWLTPAIELLPAAARRRAQVLGRAILLGYRLSGGMPAVLAGSRLLVEPDGLRLAVSPAARVPDSEAVSERLALLAAALGARRFTVAELDDLA
jgi:exopolyphosphatase/guanosine-5'-triphosphate,3'-diphosphate pyrophosphatase